MPVTLAGRLLGSQPGVDDQTYGTLYAARLFLD
jgi:hypothetical protein